MGRHRALAILGLLAGASVGRDALAGDEVSAEDVVEARGEPATRAATKVIDALREIESTMVTTEYRHGTVVRRREGHYAWDCSGMTNWLLRRLARARSRRSAASGRSRAATGA